MFCDVQYLELITYRIIDPFGAWQDYNQGLEVIINILFRLFPL